MTAFSTDFIKVSEATPHVLLVELARQPVNAFSQQFFAQYRQVFERIADEAADVRAIVLALAFAKVFVGGMDFTSLGGELADNSLEPAKCTLSIKKQVRLCRNSIAAPERCPVPVIIAVNGPVMGLGIDIISACDVRYAATDSVFCIQEADVDLISGAGMLAHLPQITGNDSLARELAYTSRPFSAVEAQKLGFVSKVVEGGRDAVVEAALDLAKVIAKKSPVAVVGTKNLMNDGRNYTVTENIEYTNTWSAAKLQTKDMSASTKTCTAKPKQQSQYHGSPRKVVFSDEADKSKAPFPDMIRQYVHWSVDSSLLVH